MEQPLVGVLMGSLSDLEVMRGCLDTLAKLGIPYEVDVSSAHRSPDKTARYAAAARERGLRVIVVGGGAAPRPTPRPPPPPAPPPPPGRGAGG